MPQPTTFTGARSPFLHAVPTAQADSQSGLASLERANEWLNSPPLTAADLRGKVVLIDFWTYTCINWLRQLPYVRAWAEKYKDQGLVVIGVHAPEFPFERNIDNVRRAVKDMGLAYPIAVDNDFAIWRAFRNQYWPALYFVDAQGRVRHHHFGEGEYEQSERFIKVAGRGRSHRHRSRAGVGRGRRCRSRRRLGQPEVSGNLRGLRAYRALCVSRRRRVGQEPCLCGPRAVGRELLGPFGRLDREEGGRCREQGRRAASRIAFTPAICISSWDR